MTKVFFEKVERLKSLFSSAIDVEAKYMLIMDWGKKAPHLSPEFKTEENIIEGCQSTTYVHTFLKEGLINIQAESDALISAGLSAILVFVYNQETPETILKNPPIFFEEIGLQNAISPNRANGLASMYVRLKKDALKYLVK
ncbi:MAG: SufE family protein [Chlamydiae bacterium]|nr:SufE family protein [Chlamydiota bacterium]